jgi:hypothetical protein
MLFFRQITKMQRFESGKKWRGSKKKEEQCVARAAGFCHYSFIFMSITQMMSGDSSER